MGKVSGLFGVDGWVKVFSYTEPKEHILQYSPWLIQVGVNWQPVKIATGRCHGKKIIAKLEGYTTRSHAVDLVGETIAIEPTQLKKLGKGEYYWTELIGLMVINLEGFQLGVVDRLMPTGAHDVMVVKGERERLIPFVRDLIIKSVDLNTGQIQVDWGLDF